MYAEPLTSSVTRLGGGPFGMWLAWMRSWGWGSDLRPVSWEGEEEGREPSLSPPREDTARGCYLQARESVLTRSQICSHLDLGLPATRTREINVRGLSHSLWYFVIAAQMKTLLFPHFWEELRRAWCQILKNFFIKYSFWKITEGRSSVQCWMLRCWPYWDPPSSPLNTWIREGAPCAISCST